MKTEKMIDNIYLGINKISGYSYKNFLESFNLDKNDFSKSTEFETTIASLFYFDYCISSKRINQEFRQKFYEICTEKIKNKYTEFLENQNLLDIIDYRYNEYSSIPMKIGKNWMQSFHNLYEVKLKGTKNTKLINKLPEIKMEGAFQSIPSKMKFISGEVKNAYLTVKAIDNIFDEK